MKQPLVSLITINYNTEDYTLELLASLQESEYENWELIIVDNSSRVDPTDKLNSLGNKVNYYRSEQNLGFAGGNNKGVELANGEYYFFVNNDTEVTPTLIGDLIEKFQSNPHIGLLSPKIVYHNTNIIQYAGYTELTQLTLRNEAVGNKREDNGEFESFIPTPYAHGAAMMTSREVVNNVGLMPELFFLYYEEVDWSQSIKEAGYEIWVDQAAKIYHKESMSIGKGNPLKTYYLTRNRILFCRRHRDFFQNFLFFSYSWLFVLPLKSLQYLIKRDQKQLKAFVNAYYWHLKN
ncbi:glycosyltransferase family 2 protein [Reichenbachiella ulvae]|uniref:Glycosyltransferase family 2 protein n=1 Tax=Reichenbachiella ulvae TaxID=2980104 RepID=A0ABT3CNC9_9BACT|nr:glycosyltransferase family 2 protein [Reichenbachiella ulvae]MCV9385028.1 glycosyltransferase family 2 protein [Reichenbachiella ulvae]